MNSIRKVVQISPRFTLIRSIGETRGSTDSAGAIRAAGGAFARLEAAHEEEYFMKQRAMQLQQLREKKIEQEAYHRKAIVQHQEAIQRHLDSIKKLQS